MSQEDGVKTPSAAEAAAQRLEALILEGSLAPGDALLPERELALRLNVSRPTLRQGVKMLEDRGLLVAQPNGGRAVAELGGEIANPLIALLSAHAEVVDDYLEFRAATEKLAARLAASRATAVDRERLSHCMAAIDAAHEKRDPLAEADADVDLHIAVYEASHNLVLLHIMRAVSGLLRRGVIENREKLFARPETRDAFRAQHRAIYEAVTAGDEDAAAAAAESHIHYTHRALKEITAAEARLEISLRRISAGEMGVKAGGRRRKDGDAR